MVTALLDSVTAYEEDHLTELKKIKQKIFRIYARIVEVQV